MFEHRALGGFGALGALGAFEHYGSKIPVFIAPSSMGARKCRPEPPGRSSSKMLFDMALEDAVRESVSLFSVTRNHSGSVLLTTCMYMHGFTLVYIYVYIYIYKNISATMPQAR